RIPAPVVSYSFASPYVIPILFFYCPLTHTPLPSFPTRRSSDLSARGRAGPAVHPGSQGGSRAPRRRRHHRLGCPAREGVGCTTRSEEHTSELQSPDHLVCRLLLEKKKRQILHVPQRSLSVHQRT